MVSNNQNKVNDCSCGFDVESNSGFPDNPMFGQSYVPIQQMRKVFRPDVGLKMGTIFPELVSPYTPCQSIREIEFLKNSNQIGEGCNE
ncbi:MAG: spore coat associated protein CotJA [Clostridia bacterium]|nr:spore coat associated protein CotJA [Clostridia bacterium]